MEDKADSLVDGMEYVTPRKWSGAKRKLNKWQVANCKLLPIFHLVEESLSIQININHLSFCFLSVFELWTRVVWSYQTVINRRLCSYYFCTLLIVVFPSR